MTNYKPGPLAGAALLVLAVMAPAFAETPAPAAPQIVMIFAAASLKNALDDAVAAYKAKTGTGVTVSYAASLPLAKQIEAGAPADIFISADVASMDYLADQNLIRQETRSNLLGNRLVVVAPKSSALQSLPFTKEAFAKAIGAGRIATGDVASVPAGKYAKAALEKLDLWSLTEPHLAPSENVRAALVFVAREEAPLGIVYATDANAEPKVKIVATFPETSHPLIVYPVALTASAAGEAPAQLLAFLKGPEAAPAFIREGFVILSHP